MLIYIFYVLNNLIDFHSIHVCWYLLRNIRTFSLTRKLRSNKFVHYGMHSNTSYVLFEQSVHLFSFNEHVISPHSSNAYINYTYRVFGDRCAWWFKTKTESEKFVIFTSFSNLFNPLIYDLSKFNWHKSWVLYMSLILSCQRSIRTIIN